MTDEQRIGQAGAEHVMEPKPAGERDRSGDEQIVPPADETVSDEPEEAWEEEERNEEAVTHGSP